MTVLDVAPSQARLSDSELDGLLADLASASAELAQSEFVSDNVRAFISELPTRLHADVPGRVSADPYLSGQAFAGVSVAAAALLGDPAKARRLARLGMEQVRQAIRDVAESRPIDEGVPAADLVKWLEATLGAPSLRLAPLVGTTQGTWQRWRSGKQEPEDVAQLRIRRLTNVVAQLRWCLTAPGVVDWFDRPHPALKAGQGTPSELLDDADGYRVLLDLAARLRTMAAT